MGGDTKKKGGKGAPKLKRSSRARTKYASQYARTYRNKLRRIRRCNGEDTARVWVWSQTVTSASPKR